MYDQWTLPNGLRVVAEQLPHLRSVSVGVWIRVGSMMENREQNGLSHFMEHMVFKGTKTRSARQIAEEMDAVGGQLNAFTSKDCTCFYAKVIDNDLPLAVDILSDLTLHAELDDVELQKERGVILEEIAMVEDTPEDQVHDLLSEAQFGQTGLGMPILGPASRIEAYSRQDLAAFRQQHYRPENVVVSLAGNYDLAKVRELIERYFGAWQGQGKPEMPSAQQPGQGIRLAREKDTEQVHICLGYPGCPLGSDDAYPLAVFNNILGGGMSSRLFQRIREELGMAYSIYTYPSAYPGSGNFNLYVGTSPKHARTVLEQIRIQMQKVLEDGIAEKEFLMGKAQLRGTYILGLESAAGRMQSIGRGELLLQHPPTPEETIAKIDRVKREDVMRIARQVLTLDPCAAIVGKHAEKYLEFVG